MRDDFQVYFPLNSGRLVRIERPYSFDKGEGTPSVEFVCGVHSDLENSLKRAFHESLELWQKCGRSTDFLASKHICIDLSSPGKNDFRDVRGESAGLALAIALLAFFSNRAVQTPIVATGRLGRGRVEPVENLAAKFSGALKNMPEGAFFFYPASQDLPGPLLREAEDKKIRAIGVHTLSEILEHLGLFSPNEAPGPVRFSESHGKRRLKRVWFIFPVLLVLLGGGLSYYHFSGGVRTGLEKGPPARAGSHPAPSRAEPVVIEAAGTWEKRVRDYLAPQLRGVVKFMKADLQVIRIVAEFEPSVSSLLALRLEIRELKCPSGAAGKPALPADLVAYSQGTGPLASRVPEVAEKLKRKVKELCSPYNSGKGFD